MDDATLSQVFEVVEMVEPRSIKLQNDMMVRKWYDGENMIEALPASTSGSLASVFSSCSLASVFLFFGIGVGRVVDVKLFLQKSVFSWGEEPAHDFFIGDRT